MGWSLMWKTYIKEAEVADEDMLKGWNASIDTLLIFAALFSAIVTAFIIESYKLMQPDFTELTYRALVHQNTSSTPENFIVSSDARLVNCLWLASLISSLLTSLIGILAKQWLVAYTSDLPPKDAARDWVCTRQFRYDALRSWRVPEFVAWLPVLLHAALLLFLAGLTVFFRSIDDATALLILIMSAAVYTLYGVTTISPLVASNAPFRSPLTPLLRRVTGFATFLGANVTALDPWNNASRSTSLLWKSIANAITWLILGSPLDEARHTTLYALGDVSEGETLCASLSSSQQRDLRRILFNVDVYALSLSDRSRHFNALLNLAEPWVWRISIAETNPQSPASSTDSLFEPLALRPRPVVERQVRGPRATFRYWYSSHFIGTIPDELAVVVIHLLLDQFYSSSVVTGRAPNSLDRSSVLVVEEAINDAVLEDLLHVNLDLKPESALRLAHALVSFHRNAEPPQQRSRLEAYLNLVSVYARSALHTGRFNSGCRVLHELLVYGLPDSAMIERHSESPLGSEQHDPWSVISTIGSIVQSRNPDIGMLTSQDEEARRILDSMVVIFNLSRQLQDSSTRLKYYSCWLDVLGNPRHARLTTWAWYAVHLMKDAVSVMTDSPSGRLPAMLTAAKAVASVLSLQYHQQIPDPWRVFYDCVVVLLRSDPVHCEILDLLLTDATLATLDSTSPIHSECFLAIMLSMAQASRTSQAADTLSFSLLLRRFTGASSSGDGHPEVGRWDLVSSFRVAFGVFVRDLLFIEAADAEGPTSAKQLLSSLATLSAIDPALPCWSEMARIIILDLTHETLLDIQSIRQRVVMGSWRDPEGVKSLQKSIDFIPDLLSFLRVVGVPPPPWLPKSLFGPIAPSRPSTIPRPRPSSRLRPSTVAPAVSNFTSPAIDQALNLTRWDPLIAWARGREELYPRLVSHASVPPHFLRQRLDIAVPNEVFSSRNRHIVDIQHASWPLTLLPSSAHLADIQQVLSPLTRLQSYRSERHSLPAAIGPEGGFNSWNQHVSRDPILETQLDEIAHRAEVRRGKRRQDDDAEPSANPMSVFIASGTRVDHDSSRREYTYSGQDMSGGGGRDL